MLFLVIPAEAGIQGIRVVLDSRFHWNDGIFELFTKPSKNKKSLTWESGARWGILSYVLKKVLLSINKSYNCQVIVYGDILKYEEPIAKDWIPTFVGMTNSSLFRTFAIGSEYYN